MSHGAVSRKTFPGGAFLSTVPCFPDLILFIQYLTEGHSEIVKIVLGHVASRFLNAWLKSSLWLSDLSVCMSVYATEDVGIMLGMVRVSLVL